jgi:hypothetical protein
VSTRPFVAFDIETAPSPRALSLPPDEEHLTRGVREDFKPETKERYLQRNLAEWPVELAKRGALDWRLGRIVAAGTARTGLCSGVPSMELVVAVVAPEEEPGAGLIWAAQLRAEVGRDNFFPKVHVYSGERQLVAKVWEEVGARRDGDLPQLSGFAVRTFDLPWLLGRTAALDLLPSRRFVNNRYMPGEVVDWADVLAWYDAFPRKGWTLAQYAEWFDLPHRPWGEGKDVPAWLEAGDHYSVVKHLAFDLLTTHALHERFAPVYLVA